MLIKQFRFDYFFKCVERFHAHKESWLGNSTEILLICAFFQFIFLLKIKTSFEVVIILRTNLSCGVHFQFFILILVIEIRIFGSEKFNSDTLKLLDLFFVEEFHQLGSWIYVLKSHWNEILRPFNLNRLINWSKICFA